MASACRFAKSTKVTLSPAARRPRGRNDAHSLHKPKGRTTPPTLRRPERVGAPPPERVSTPPPERVSTPLPERVSAPLPERRAALFVGAVALTAGAGPKR